MNDMRQRVTDQIKWIRQLIYEEIPDDVKQRARWILLDSIGCIINGLGDERLPDDKNEALLKSSSAMVSTELYEGNRFAVGHPACHIVPLLMIEMENRKALSYGEFIRIFICAYELSSRWGSTVRFSNYMLGHGTILSSGAAVVEGLLEDMDEEKFVNYIMTCEALPEVSTWQSVFEGSAIHDYYPGIAAENAKNALYMVSNGVKSSENLIKSVYEKIEGTRIIENNLEFDDTRGWIISKNYFKVHSGCRFIHPFADVIEQFMKEGLKKENVEEIHIYTYKKAAMISSQHVTNSLAAKFSTPVSLAILLSQGSLYPDDIDRAVEDPELQTLASRIYLEEDDKYNQMLPDVRGGLVKVILKDGRIMEREVFHAHGDFDDPDGYSEEQLINKFRIITNGKISSGAQNDLIESILRGSDDGTAYDIFESYFENVR